MQSIKLIKILFIKTKLTVIHFLILMLYPILISCVYYNYPDYPKEWGSIITKQGTDRCVELTGNYLNQDNTKELSLSWILLGITRDVKITHAKISQPTGDSLLITFMNENKSIKEMTYYKNKNFQCNNNEVIIRPGAERPDNSGVLGVSHLITHLMKNEDGWLVVKIRNVEYGLFGALIPIASENDIWYRFAPLR